MAMSRCSHEFSGLYLCSCDYCRLCPYSNCFKDYHLDLSSHCHCYHVVFKVEHQGIVRRINAYKSDEEGLRLPKLINMEELRAKIIHLFNFGEGSNLDLRYEDSESELVTFSSDEELRDAILYQRLNPLWIHVTPNVTEKFRQLGMAWSKWNWKVNESNDPRSGIGAINARFCAWERSNRREELDEETERALMDELRELGFFDDERNRRVLRRNEHDLEKTVTYLLRTRRSI